VESLLQDGYSVEEIGAFYGLTARRVRRFLRRHGLQEPAEAEVAYEALPGERGAPARGSRSSRAAPGAYVNTPLREDPFDDPWGSGTPPRAIGSASARPRGQRLSAAQIDELCARYLDPSLSLAEVAAYFDLDADAALELINKHLTGIMPRQET
jgi:hypothetical protein